MIDLEDKTSLALSAATFLYQEADLLDEWKLPEWEALLADDAHYSIPPIGTDGAMDASSTQTMFVVSDHRDMISARIVRLMGPHAHAESPRSRLRRMISNIQVVATEGDEIVVTSNVVVYRIRRMEIVSYIGKYRHRLRRAGDTFQIVEKRVVLDMDVLSGQGGISIIL